ncbi:YaaR family protein [Bacillus rubiinfantis]|uniref:YaaR family protein n=1 Tax=Bacillus rubiinfantis TaxID=1499680 RepID=UPI0005A64F12|nr:YaaR family protein [Bacillus rubiinfantis]
MKIQDQVRVNIGDTRTLGTDRNAAPAASFQKIMHSYSKDLTKEYLHKLLENIDQQGKQLSENPNFHELRKYKDLVKQFMSEITKNGLNLTETESWDPYGGSRTLKTVQVVDHKLMELTNHVLHEQTDGLSLLERIGEIKGMLINLYT